MIFIFGGSYQRKLKFALDKFNLTKSDVCDLRKEMELEKKVIYHAELLCDSVDLKALADKIIISEDIGEGIVPIEKTDRDFREKVGRLNQKIAENSEEVYRVFCGIGIRIK